MSELYLKYEYWLAFTQLLLAMLGMGATLRVADFIAVIKIPKAFCTGLSIQLLLVPVLVASALYLFDLDPGFAIGLAVIAAIPGGTSSNIYTFFARGRVALSIAITSLTTVACLFTVPLILQLLITSYVPADFNLPMLKIAVETALAILLPLIVGMAVLHKAPVVAKVISRWSIRASLTVIVLIIVGASTSGRLDWQAFGGFNAAFLTSFALLLLLLGFFIPKLVGLPRADIVAINMEVTVRNVNLAVLIIASLFPATDGSTSELGSMALFTVLAYGGVMMVPALILIVGNRLIFKERNSATLSN